MGTMPRNIKNSGNELTDLDFPQVLKKSYNDDNQALDVVSVDSLVHERFYKVFCTYITLPSGTDEIETVTYYSQGINQTHEIVCAGYPAGKGEITLVSFLNQSAALLGGKYFIIYDAVGSVGIWFNTDTLSSHPVTGALRDIEIPIATGDSAASLAAKTAGVMTLDPQFYASTVGFNAAVITTVVGDKPNATSGTSGLIINSQDGLDSMAGNYFLLQNVGDTQSYYVWYKVDGAGTDPAIMGATGILVNILNTDNPDSIAAKTAQAINNTNNLFLICTTSGAKIIAKYGQFGISTGISNGNTRFSFNKTIDGADCPIVAKLFVTYGANNEIETIERITVGENTN
jgi:hypothetical protein